MVRSRTSPHWSTSFATSMEPPINTGRYDAFLNFSLDGDTLTIRFIQTGSRSVVGRPVNLTGTTVGAFFKGVTIASDPVTDGVGTCASATVSFSGFVVPGRYALSTPGRSHFGLVNGLGI